MPCFYRVLFRHRIEVLREIALHLRELSVLPPFQHSRPQSLRSFWPAAGIESSGSNHYERTKEITEFWLSGSLRICIYGACLKWLLPELSIPAAGQKDRRLWGRECLFKRTQRFICLVNIFSNNLLYSRLEFLTTARMPVRGSKHLESKRKAAIALEVKVPEDIEVHCCGKWRQDWLFFVKDLRQLSSCYARRICKTSPKYG